MSDTSPTLYELDSQVTRLQQRYEAMLESSDGEITDEVEQFIEEDLDPAESALRDKLDGYGKFIRHLDARIDDLRAQADRIESNAVVEDTRLQKYHDEADRLRSLADDVESKKDDLLDVLKFWMYKHGVKSVETKNFAFEIKGVGGKNPVEITGAVPERYLRHSFRVRYIPREIDDEDAMKLANALQTIRSIAAKYDTADTRQRRKQLKSYIGDCIDADDETAQQFAKRVDNVKLQMK